MQAVAAMYKSVYLSLSTVPLGIALQNTSVVVQVSARHPDALASSTSFLQLENPLQDRIQKTVCQHF